MRHLLAPLVLTLVLLTHSTHLRAQDAQRFIENYKLAYERYINKAKFDTTLTYVPSIMNLYEKTNRSWFNLSRSERQQKLWAYICPPVLANNFALDVVKGEYFSFPEGWLYHILPSKRVNQLISQQFFPYGAKKLLEYLQNNHADYIFTITNVGDGSIDGRYWVITNDQLYILRYNKDIDELFSVEAMEFMTDNIEFFEYPWEKQ